MAFKISNDTIINDSAQFGSDLTLVNEDGISYITETGAFTSDASGNSIYLGYGSSLVDVTAPNVTFSSGNSNVLDFTTDSSQSAYRFVMKITGNRGRRGDANSPPEISFTSPTGTSNRFYRFDASVDGIHWYGYDRQNDKFMHFTASTAWDASTLSLSDEFSISGTDSASRDLAHIRISENGEYFYRSTHRNIYKYDLSTPWDISSASLASTTPHPMSPLTFDIAINFKRDGTKMLLSDHDAPNKSAIYELSTPWDTSTLTKIKKVDYGFASGNSLKLSPDGTEVLGLSSGPIQTTIYKYDWLTPWELDSTRSNSFGDPKATSSVTRTLIDFVRRPGGHLDWKLLALSGAFADRLYKYDTTDSAGATIAEKLQFPGNVNFENGFIEFPDSGQTSYVEFISIDSGSNWYAKELYKG